MGTDTDSKQGFGALAGKWFTELSSLWPGQGLSLKVTDVLYHERSEFQDICVFETDSIYKRVLTLDGVIQVTTHDECSYQEMITHLPLCALPDAPRRVCIIGGGDGGVAREVAKHTSVESIHMCEIDRAVTEVSKRFFPQLAAGFDDARLQLMFRDGIDFLREAKEGTYDAIIVDSSDPVGPAEVLFEKPFFEHMHRALRPGGVICTQAESVWLHMGIIKSLAAMCSEVFQGGSVHYGYTTIPTYPSGQIGFMLCAKQCDGQAPLDVRTAQRHVPSQQCQYYNPELHSAAFVLPTFVRQQLSDSLTYQS